MKGKEEPDCNPETGLPGAEKGLEREADPGAVLSRDLRDLERQLSNVPASGEKHSPMEMYRWMDSKVNVYSLPNQEIHKNLLKGLVYGNSALGQKILHAMKIEEAARGHGIKDYPIKVLLEEILFDLVE